jgi:hypothetical protein
MFVIRAVTIHMGIALGHSGCNPDASQILMGGIISRPLPLAHVGEPPAAGRYAASAHMMWVHLGLPCRWQHLPCLSWSRGERDVRGWVATDHIFEAWVV